MENNYQKDALNLFNFRKEKLDIIREVKSYRLDKNRFIISVRSEHKLNIKISIEFVSADIIRFKMVVGNKIPLNNTYMLSQNFSEYCPTFKKKDNTLLLKTEKINIKINMSPWFLSLLDNKNTLILEEEYQDRRWWPDGDFLSPPLSIQKENSEFKFFQSFSIQPNEQFWGMGERFGPIALRGQEIVTFLKFNGYSSENSCFKPINFFMSSNGYGIFINTYRPCGISFGKRMANTLTFAIKDQLLDFFIFLPPTFKKILKLYSQITGFSPLPPKWSFGIWMSRDSYRSQKEVEKVALRLRKEKLPCDVIHIDPGWMLVDDRIPYYGSNEYGCYWECNLQWNKHFPMPEKMLDKLKKMGFKVSLWEIPRLSRRSKIYEEAKSRGFLVKKQDGSIYGEDSDLGGYVDFTNPSTVKWFKEKHKKLLAQGVSCFKADSGEGGPIDGIYYSMNGKDAKQIYSFLYNKALFEAVKEFSGEGFVWASTGFAGSQRYPIVWGGDNRALYGDISSSLRSAISLGLSGIPFWSMDIGGWWFPLDEELYIRMMQVGLFCSHARFHGNTPREPWHFSKKVVNLYIKYAKLRYCLLPYLYSQAYLSTKTGLPIIRALVLEFQDDPASWCIDDEFLFGENILVAPILSRQNIRFVYLPKGIWFNFWNKKILKGPRAIRYNAPISILPLFVKGNAIIPIGTPLNYVDEKPLNLLNIEVYVGDKNGKGILYEGNKEYVFLYTLKEKKITLNLPLIDKDYQIKIYGLSTPKKILCFFRKSNRILLHKYMKYKDFVRNNNGWFLGKDYIFIKIKKPCSPIMLILYGTYRKEIN